MAISKLETETFVDAPVAAFTAHLTSWEFPAPEVRGSQILDGAQGADATVRYVLAGFGRGATCDIRYSVEPGLVTAALVHSPALRQFESTWVLEEAEGGRTRCVYRVVAEARLPIPGVLQRAMLRRLADVVVKGVGKRAERGAEEYR